MKESKEMVKENSAQPPLDNDDLDEDAQPPMTRPSVLPPVVESESATPDLPKPQPAPPAGGFASIASISLVLSVVVV